jgi:2-amino-4-hydroxy-6-hydroxymethyldihydropteridine diphosphokinase
MNNGIFLLLGSNVGDRPHLLKQAISLIANQVGNVVRQSSVYETAPWGKLDQQNFLNQVLEIASALPASDLLTSILSIETALGRTRDQRWGPRTIDIDILLYRNFVIKSDALTIPHPSMHERRFTLVPLVELAPDVIHPVLNKSFKELLDNCPDEQAVKKYKA